MCTVVWTNYSIYYTILKCIIVVCIDLFDTFDVFFIPVGIPMDIFHSPTDRIPPSRGVFDTALCDKVYQ